MTTASTPEILDIAQAIDRWDELLDRIEAGESFTIAVDGVPRATMQPVHKQISPLKMRSNVD